MILYYLVTALVVILSLVIQGHSSFDCLRVAGAKPDLLFVVIVYIAYNFGQFKGEICGFIGGLLQDAISNSPMGLMAFSKMTVALLVGLVGKDVIKKNPVSIFLLLFVASLAKGILVFLLSAIFARTDIGGFKILFVESLYTAVVGIFLFKLFDVVYRGSKKDSEEE